MKPCFVIAIITPKKYKLDGLWFGPKKPKRVIVFTHGLASSAFNTDMASKWIDSKTAVITFSNRGHDNISRVRRLTNTKKGYTSYTAGMAHEVFTDSTDDLQGVIDFAKVSGAKEVYLAGHSTGCQKSVFYASKKNVDTLVKGLILLAPMSDYADVYTFDENNRLAKVTKIAEDLVKKGDKHALLPEGVWPYPVDAQRFLSLFSPKSKEEIFCYAQPGKKPTTLKKVTTPILSIFAGADEYADRPIQDIADWFIVHTSSGEGNTVSIIPDVLHNFRGGHDSMAKLVKAFIKKVSK